MEAGEEFRIVPSCPNQIDRIEAGMISHLGDTTLDENPLELNLPKFYDLDQDPEERHNVINEPNYAEQVEDLQRQLDSAKYFYNFAKPESIR